MSLLVGNHLSEEEKAVCFSLTLIPPIFLCPENVVCFLGLLHILTCISDSILSFKKTQLTLIGQVSMLFAIKAT